MQKFTLNTDVKEKIKNIQAKHTFRKEIGGILIGAYDAEIERLRLTDMTFPFPGDQQSRYRFFRKADGHQEIMDQLWEEYEGVLSKLILYHSTNETVYGGMICVGDNLRIEFDDITEKDIKILYNDASNKEVSNWKYSNLKGVYVCPVCGVEQTIMTSVCPCCGTEFDIDYNVVI